MHIEVIIAAWLFILGASFGSFINVVVDRGGRGESILGRSYCEKCKKVLRWYELIPVLSYIILRGKCSTCCVPVPIRLLIIEVLSGFLFMFPFLFFGLTFVSFLLIISGFLFLYIALWDYLYMEIPTPGVVLLWATGLIFNGFSAPMYMISGIPVVSLFIITYVLSRGNAMGFGDVLLVFVVSALLPLSLLFLGVYVGIVCGGVVAMFLLLLRVVHRKSHIPFGPFLVFGFYGMLFWSLIKI